MAVVASTPVPLRDLPAGCSARLHHVDVDPRSADLLRALGLTAASDLRLCKAGEPCIIQIGTTRIGVSRAVAAGILVVPLADPTA